MWKILFWGENDMTLYSLECDKQTEIEQRIWYGLVITMLSFGFMTFDNVKVEMNMI